MALYIGLHAANTLVARAIRWQTRSEWSHASLVWKGGAMVEAREGKGVVATRNFEDVRRSQKSQLLALRDPLTIDRAVVVWNFAQRQLGKPYDYTMALRFITRRQATRKSSGKWFCSELVFAAFLEAGVELLRDVEPWRVSPGHLAMSPLLMPVDRAE